MSTRTRSSTRIQALHNADDLNGTTDSRAQQSQDNEEQSFNLEEKEQEIWDELRDEHYDSEPFRYSRLRHLHPTYM